MVILINKKKWLSLIILSVLLLSVFSLNKSFNVFNTVEEPFYKGNKENSKCIAITCNVDWGEEYIDQMLKILNDNNAKITFMVTGRWAEKNPDILLKIKKAGHEIGNHGNMHLDYSNFDYDGNYKEIKKAKEKIENIINEETKFFEPPSGYYNKDTVRAAKDLNYIPIKWSIDTIDWKYKDNKNEIINRIKTREMEDGSIILMHPTKATAESLQTIISIVKDKGYNVGKLSDIFKVE